MSITTSAFGLSMARITSAITCSTGAVAFTTRALAAFWGWMIGRVAAPVWVICVRIC
jgi:hypothetical protein